LTLTLACPVHLAVNRWDLHGRAGAGPWDEGLSQVSRGWLVASRDPVAQTGAAFLMSFRSGGALRPVPFSCTARTTWPWRRERPGDAGSEADRHRRPAWQKFPINSNRYLILYVGEFRANHPFDCLTVNLSQQSGDYIFSGLLRAFC